MSEKRCKTRKPVRDGLSPSDLLMAFFVAAIAFLVAAGLVTVLGQVGVIDENPWLALHLALVGGVSQLVIGAAQFFAGAFLASGPPPRKLVRGQFVAWNCGTLLLVLGEMSGRNALVGLGGASLLVGMALFGLALRDLRRQSLQSFPWATRWYRAAAAFLLVGVAVGVALINSAEWSHGDLVATHLTLNLIGWFGTAIVGSLHTFFPSLAGGRLWRPQLQAATFLLWIAGVSSLAFGFAFSFDTLQGVGLASLILAAALLLANLVGTAREKPLSFAARLVGYAQLFLALGLGVLLASLLMDRTLLAGEAKPAAAELLLAGWIGLTVAGSLIHLLGVLVSVRNLQSIPSRDGRSSPPLPATLIRFLPGLAVVAVLTAAAATLAGQTTASAAAMALVGAIYLLLLVAAVRLAVRSARTSPLKL